jgi:hypothetical protein
MPELHRPCPFLAQSATYNASRTCTVKKSSISPSSIHCHVNLDSSRSSPSSLALAMSRLHRVHHLQASTDSTCLTSTYSRRISRRSCAGILFLTTPVFLHYPPGPHTDIHANVCARQGRQRTCCHFHPLSSLALLAPN